MRFVHLAIIVIFVAATLIFALQNLQSVTMSFLGYSLRMPLALQAIVTYLLGMATGGSLWTLLRRSIEGTRRTDAA
jgi:putative membrane protein